MTLHKRNLAVALAVLLSAGYGYTPATAETPSGDAAGRVGHFDAKGKPPSQHTMVDFDPRFPIMPGTQLRPTENPEIDPYAVEFGAPVPE